MGILNWFTAIKLRTADPLLGIDRVSSHIDYIVLFVLKEFCSNSTIYFHKHYLFVFTEVYLFVGIKRKVVMRHIIMQQNF